jgi:putative glutamine amidotransferase
MIKKTNKIIGIPCWSTGENSFGCTKHYLDFISRFGNVRMIMPWEEKVKVDVLFLPGGMDTSPSNYGEYPSFHAGNQDVFKEYFFTERLKNYIDDTPIFAVCLGMQVLNVLFGGSLTQNLLYHAQSKGRWEGAHKVYREIGYVKPKGAEGTVLTVRKSSELGYDVNSHHHQAVTLDRLADCLQPLLYAPNEDYPLTGEKFLIEGFKHKSLPIIGLQYHPEELIDRYACDWMSLLLADKPQTANG